MKINPKNFRVQEGEKIKLKKWPTLVKPAYQSTQQYRELLGKQVGTVLQKGYMIADRLLRPAIVTAAQTR